MSFQPHRIRSVQFNFLPLLPQGLGLTGCGAGVSSGHAPRGSWNFCFWLCLEGFLLEVDLASWSRFDPWYRLWQNLTRQIVLGIPRGIWGFRPKNFKEFWLNIVVVLGLTLPSPVAASSHTLGRSLGGGGGLDGLTRHRRSGPI